MGQLKAQIITKLQQMRNNNAARIIDMDSFNDMLDDLIETIKSHLISYGDASIYKDLKAIAKNIRTTKEEVANIDVTKMQADLPNVALQLQTINSSTLYSTEKIIDATENIQKLVQNIENNELKKQILDHCCVTMAACGINDLTSQRIKKITKVLTDVEHIIYKMLITFKCSNNHKYPNPNQSQLDGPQLDTNTPTQQDIDNLFKSL